MRHSSASCELVEHATRWDPTQTMLLRRLAIRLLFLLREPIMSLASRHPKRLLRVGHASGKVGEIVERRRGVHLLRPFHAHSTVIGLRVRKDVLGVVALEDEVPEVDAVLGVEGVLEALNQTPSLAGVDLLSSDVCAPLPTSTAP